MEIHIHVHSRCRGAVKRCSQIAMLVALAVVPSQSQILNKNLIVNGDAEAGTASASSTGAAVSVPNWTTTGGFTVGSYGESGFISTSDFGPVKRGKQFFYGGLGSAVSSATQVVDLSGAATEIDAGLAKFQLSGYLGLLGGSYDNVTSINLAVDFQDAAGTTLLHAIANGPTIEDLDCCMPEGLLQRIASGFLPLKVRKATVTVYLSTGGSGSGGNNYAADSVELALTTDRLFGVNLLTNGDGETDPGAEEVPAPGWNSTAAFVARKWGDDNMPKANDPGPANRGKYFFNCTTWKPCRAYQTFDFTSQKSLVDAGKVNFSLAGWLGGDTGLPDNVDVNVTFYDSANKAVGAPAKIGPVTMQERNGQTGLWQRSTGGVVPAGARLAQVTMTFHRLNTSDEASAYADNLSFTLSVMQVTAVVNAASWLTGPVAAGEFVTLAGSGLGTLDGAVGMQKGLAGSKVFFNGIEAWQTYASDNQINVIVPYGVSNHVDVTVQYNGKTSDAFPVAMTESSPGIFTSQFGGGPAVAVNNGISFNSAANPVARNGAISFWATGQGAVSPAGQDGEGISGWKELMLAKKVTIGGVDAQIQFAGLIYTGEIQVNAIVPANAPTGDVEVVLTIGNAVSRKGVTISVK